MDHGCAPFVTAVSVFLRHAALVRSRLCGLVKVLEPDRQPVAVRRILDPVRPIDQRSGNSLQPEFQKRAVMDFEQPVGDVNSVIRVDADQVNEGRMMELRQILAARLHR